jgi:hypothetical protein
VKQPAADFQVPLDCPLVVIEPALVNFRATSALSSPQNPTLGLAERLRTIPRRDDPTVRP